MTNFILALKDSAWLFVLCGLAGFASVLFNLRGNGHRTTPATPGSAFVDLESEAEGTTATARSGGRFKPLHGKHIVARHYRRQLAKGRKVLKSRPEREGVVLVQAKGFVHESPEALISQATKTAHAEGPTAFPAGRSNDGEAFFGGARITSVFGPDETVRATTGTRRGQISGVPGEDW
jgi:hypothetical protein